MHYGIVFTSTFDETFKKLIKGDQEKETRTKKAIKLLRNSPFYPSLKNHKVNTRNFGKKWSSWVTGDLRIIWDFDQNTKEVIFLFTVAKHSGSYKE